MCKYEGRCLGKRIEKEFKPPKYVMLTLDELIRLIICVILDVVEYAVPILLAPVVGDMLDVIGIVAGIIMFGWIGFLSIIEFVPMADILPIFVLTWAIWYYLKKKREKREIKEWKKKWM
jgi:hypothetical protein